MSEAQRLQKLLAAAGVASRRASEELIRDGRVTVDGSVAELGMRALPTADIRVDGERVHVDTEHVYVMLNKPPGVVTTADDPEGRPTVLDLVNLDQRLFPVGRLDMDTEGMLLLTNDGDLAHQLMHPRFGVPRTYVVLTTPIRKAAVARLREGAELEDGWAKPVSVRQLNATADNALIEVVMTEGRKREVRRLFEACDVPLLRLARIAYGGVDLGELRQGKWRFLTPHEVGTLRESVAGGRGGRSAETKASRSERRRRGGPQGHGRGGGSS